MVLFIDTRHIYPSLILLSHDTIKQEYKVLLVYSICFLIEVKPVIQLLGFWDVIPVEAVLMVVQLDMPILGHQMLDAPRRQLMV